MKNDMILIAMNGRDLVGLGHSEVAEEVKSGGKNVIFCCKFSTEVLAEKISGKDFIDLACSDSDEND